MSARIAWFAMCSSVLAAVAVAQLPDATPRLVPIGTVLVRGSGEVVGCLITADSARALTVGSRHDLVYWDLEARRPLRHFARFDQPIANVRLHPADPTAIVSFARGKNLRLDLASGKQESLSVEQVDALPRPQPDGWLIAKEVGGGSVAANGEHRIEKGRRVPNVVGQRFRGVTWLANNGTVLEAEGAAVRLWGLVGAGTEFFEHCGAPQQLAFSPDGRHLAISSLGGTQFVDAAGNEVVRLQGLRLVQPGPGPDEFWMLGVDSMRRWSGTRTQHVGDPVAWPWRTLRLVAWNQDDEPALRPVVVRGGQPWTPDAARMTDGSFRPLAFTRPREPAKPGSIESYRWLARPEVPLMFQSAGDAAAPMLLTSVRSHDKFTPAESTLRRLGDDGATTHHVAFDESAQWLAVSRDGARVWVGMTGGNVHAYDSQTLAPLASKMHSPPLTTAVVLDSGHLLAASGNRLLRLDAASLAVIDELVLAEPRMRIALLASSLDGRRVAIGQGTEVRLFALE